MYIKPSSVQVAGTYIVDALVKLECCTGPDLKDLASHFQTLAIPAYLRDALSEYALSLIPD